LFCDSTLRELGNESEQDTDKLNAARFQEIFIEEAFDLINQLEEKMLQLESDPSDQGMIDQVFRIMHTLKGNSNMFGYKNMAEITHELENIYDMVRSGKMTFSHAILDITLQCIDHFRNLVNDPELNRKVIRGIHAGIMNDIRLKLATDQRTSKPEIQKKSAKYTQSQQTFYLFFKPERDVFNDGTNPLYFVYDLHEIGECMPVTVFEPEMTGSEFNPEMCYTAWHIIIVFNGTEEDLREHFLFLREGSQPFIKTLTTGNMLKNKQFADFFMKEAKTMSGPIEFEMSLFVTEDSKVELKGATSDPREAITSVRVASQKIDKMMNLVSELVAKQAELSMLVAGSEDQRLVEVTESIEKISRDLRDNAFSISLIPLEKSVLRFQRLVRDVANRFEKKVDFMVEGKETELDKTIIEKIVDPIMHILRNSIDHGIEKPTERIKKGKPETGTIVLKAYPSGAYVVIEISDDGAGINLEKVKDAAVRKGMVSRHEQIEQDALLQLIVSPGFTTAENISEVSGRGVGMDVVNQKISEFRGELELSTEKDKGTTITIKLPLTISIIDSILVKIGAEKMLVPLSVVERVAEVRAEAFSKNDNKYIVLNKEYIPYIDIRNEFLIIGERPVLQHALLVKYKEIKVGLIIDEVIGNYQAVLKSLGESYKKQEVISGASILGSGDIALVLDTNKLIQEFTQRNELKVNANAKSQNKV
jgi:two-component system, chemotaxis family, sensor kinase CheA